MSIDYGAKNLHNFYYSPKRCSEGYIFIFSFFINLILQMRKLNLMNFKRLAPNCTARVKEIRTCFQRLWIQFSNKLLEENSCSFSARGWMHGNETENPVSSKASCHLLCPPTPRGHTYSAFLLHITLLAWEVPSDYAAKGLIYLLRFLLCARKHHTTGDAWNVYSGS